MAANDRPGTPDKPHPTPPGGKPGSPGKPDDPNGPQSVPAPGGAGNANLPKLSEAMRDRLEKLFDEQGNFGVKSGPSEAAVRRLVRQGLAAGLNEKQAGNFLNPAFYRGINDPSGGGKLLHDLTPDQLMALSKYAGKQSGSGLNDMGGSTQAQADFFKEFPDLQAKYMGLLGWSDDRIAVAQETGHDPGEAGSASPWYANWQRSQGGDAGTTDSLYQPFTNFTSEQYPVTPFADAGTAMDAAHTALASHYASAAAAGNFEAAGAAFGALQQHNDYMAQNTQQPQTNSFTEGDLYNEAQFR